MQTSYLSQISQIIFVEKNLSCGEISDFCKEFEQFMEFYRNLCHFCSKFVWRNNYKYEVCENPPGTMKNQPETMKRAKGVM